MSSVSVQGSQATDNLSRVFCLVSVTEVSLIWELLLSPLPSSTFLSLDPSARPPVSPWTPAPTSSSPPEFLHFPSRIVCGSPLLLGQWTCAVFGVCSASGAEGGGHRLGEEGGAGDVALAESLCFCDGAGHRSGTTSRVCQCQPGLACAFAVGL